MFRKIHQNRLTEAEQRLLRKLAPGSQPEGGDFKKFDPRMEVDFGMYGREPNKITSPETGKTWENSSANTVEISAQQLRNMFQNEFEKSYNRKVGRSPDLRVQLGSHFESFFEQVTNHVFNMEQFQRGVVAYMDLHSQFWKTAWEGLQSMAATGNIDPNHRIFRSSAYQRRLAPGIYKIDPITKERTLVRASVPYAFRTPPSQFAIQQMRQTMGKSVNPSYTHAQNKMADLRTGYGKAMERIVRKEMLVGNLDVKYGTPEWDKEVQRQVDKRLKAKLDPQTLRDYENPTGMLVGEFDLPKDPLMLKYVTDFKYRGLVAAELNDALDLNAASLDDVDEKLHVDEVQEGSKENALPQILYYSTKEKIHRNRRPNSREGLVFVEQKAPEEMGENDVSVVEFNAVKLLMEATNEGWINTGDFTEEENEVLEFMKDTMKGFDPEQLEAYMLLHNNLLTPEMEGDEKLSGLQKAIQGLDLPYPLDQVISMTRKIKSRQKILSVILGADAKEILGGEVDYSTYYNLIKNWEGLGEEPDELENRVQLMRVLQRNVDIATSEQWASIFTVELFDNVNKRDAFLEDLEAARSE